MTLPASQADLPAPVKWVLCLSFCFAMGIFIFFAEVLLNVERAPIRMSTYAIFVGLAAWGLLGVQYVRRKSLRRLSSEPERAAEFRRLRYLLLLIMAESTVLWGVCARVLGATRSQVVPFYLVGAAIILLAIWETAHPESGEDHP